MSAGAVVATPSSYGALNNVALIGSVAGMALTVADTSGSSVPTFANAVSVLGGGTGLTATGANGHVLTAASGAWTSAPPAPAAGLSGGAASDFVYQTSGTTTGFVSLTGMVVGNGASAPTAPLISQYSVLLGGSGNIPTYVSPGATGIPLVSTGGTGYPAFTTATVPGGGTGQSTLTVNQPVCGGTSSTGLVQQVAAIGQAGIPLVSGTSGTGLPSYTTAAIAGGGTGSTSYVNNGVIVADGTAATLLSVGPSNPGNVLTSNGTVWQSTAPAPAAGLSGGAASDFVYQTSGTTTGFVSLTGMVVGNGASAPTAPLISQYSVLLGGSGNIPTYVSPGATGIPLVSTGGTGYPAFTTAAVAGGGTGIVTVSTNTNQPICGGATATGVFQSVTAGSSGQPLTSQGAGLPVYANLTVPNGGTGQTTLAQYGVVLGNGASGVNVTSPGTAGTFLGGTATNPTFQALSGASVGTATNLAGGGILTSVYQSAAGTTAYTAAGAANQTFFVNSGTTAIVAGTLPVGGGGTGIATVTTNTNQPICGGGTATGAFQSVTAIGTAGIPLVSGTSGTGLPSYTTAVVAGGGTGIVTVSTNTNQPICGGATATGVFQSVTAGSSGQPLTSQGAGIPVYANLTVPNGGTGQTTLAQYGVVLGNGASGVNVTSPGTTGQFLAAATSANPGWATLGYNIVTPFSGASSVGSSAPSTQTYSPNANMTHCDVYFIGTGGGGGGAGATSASQFSCGVGGGGGGYAVVSYTRAAIIAIGATVTITFNSATTANAGNGGAAATTTSNPGIVGGTTTFGSGTGSISITGGVGGIVQQPTASGGTVLGVAGGVVSITAGTGVTVRQQSNGSPSAQAQTIPLLSGYGSAGGAAGCGGGNGAHTQGGTGAAGAMGGGGGGTSNLASGSALTGGAGGAAQVVVVEYLGL